MLLEHVIKMTHYLCVDIYYLYSYDKAFLDHILSIQTIIFVLSLVLKFV